MRTRSLRPVSKNTSCPSVNSSRAPPKRDLSRRADFATPRMRPTSREKNVTTRSLSPSGKLPITTAAEVPRPMSGGQPESEFLQRPAVLPPVVAHLHVQLQEDLDAEERLELAAGGGADALEHGAGLADQDPLLRVLLDEDRGLHVDNRWIALLGQLLD